MLLGYVSDEKYVALADVTVELIDAAGQSWETRSRASGAVHADVPDGDYDVVLAKAGYGSKRVPLRVAAGQTPYQFRLLSDGLFGYAWPKWVRSGEIAEFRVHSVEPYKLELWRYGWDKGFVRGLGWHDEHGPRATMQITPDGDYTQTGVGWNKVGYGSPSHQQLVEAPRRSGLYYFHARTPSGLAFAFPWIVAPAQPAAPLAVLASNITWNAYNSFGGRSNYINADRLPPTPVVNSRQELKRYTEPEHQTWGSLEYAPLSFDRPEPINHIDLAEKITDPIEGRAACHIAPAEWRLFGWLEREGFSYDFYGETQLHDGVLDLSQYRVLIISTHPEYWSRTMYERVKQWVLHEGGRLMYLGGNGLNCEVEFLDADTMVVQNGAMTSLWPEGIGAESRMAKRVRIGSQSARRRVHARRHHDRCSVPRHRRETLGLRRHGPPRRRHVRRKVASTCAAPAARPATRPTRSRPSPPPRTSNCSPKVSTPTTAAPTWSTSTRPAAARCSRSARSPTPARCRSTITCRPSRRTSYAGFWGSPALPRRGQGLCSAPRSRALAPKSDCPRLAEAGRGAAIARESRAGTCAELRCTPPRQGGATPMHPASARRGHSDAPRLGKAGPLRPCPRPTRAGLRSCPG